MKDNEVLPSRDGEQKISGDIMVKIKGELVTMTLIEALDLAGVLTACVQVKLSGR